MCLLRRDTHGGENMRCFECPGGAGRATGSCYAFLVHEHQHGFSLDELDEEAGGSGQTPGGVAAEGHMVDLG